MKSKIMLYEELSLNAHPALQTQLYDGWILRFANGYTNRANSINPIYPSTIDLQTKINACQTRYFTQGLPAVYKLTDGSDPSIDPALDKRGYAFTTPTYVMDMDIQRSALGIGDCVFASNADDAWFQAYFAFSRYTECGKIATARQILQNVKNTMICGRIMKSGTTVACGSAVIERGYAALQNIVVDAPHRGKGYGKELCTSLLAAAKRVGAHTAYLQVVQANHQAAGLYTKLGFKTAYAYWYRAKKENA